MGLHVDACVVGTTCAPGVLHFPKTKHISRTQTSEDVDGEMLLPNLFRLSIGETLFDDLAKSGGGKDNCNFHKDRLVPPDEQDKPDYYPPEEDDENCATEGYLMYKPVNTDGGPVKYKHNAYNGKTIEVTTSSETGEQSITLQPLLTRSATVDDRVTYFEHIYRDWIKDVFPVTCKRPDGLLRVRWDLYGETLLEHSEWYYIDPQNSGHLFISFVDNITMKKKLHLPELQVGCFEGKFIYIVLVCAQAGAGKTLLSVADAVASKLGADGVALSSLSNSAGAYFNAGYEFVSKSDGKPINVEKWVQEVKQPNGKVKRVLNTTVPRSDVQERRGTKRQGEFEDDKGSEETPTPGTEEAEQREYEEGAEHGDGAYKSYSDERWRLIRLLYDTLKRARIRYRQFSELSYEIM